MALNITKSNETIEVKRLNIVLYGMPGTGKTSLAFTAKEPLLLDFEGGAIRAVGRKDIVLAEKWSDVVSISESDLREYSTIIIDPIGKALDSLADHIIETNPKLSLGGALNQRGWGQLGLQFKRFLSRLNSFGKDVIIVSHLDERSTGEEVRDRLKASGGSKDEVTSSADTIGRVAFIGKKRVVDFAPSEISLGKDPAGLGAVEIPDAASAAYSDFLDSLVEQIKDHLNALSAEQAEHQIEINWFQNALRAIETADGINELLPRAKAGGRDISSMLVKRAGELGLHFDPTKKKYFLDVDEACQEAEQHDSEAKMDESYRAATAI